MSEDSSPNEKGVFRGSHQFIVFLCCVVIIASVLVLISMQLYSTSGAAQLDLSRPGYVELRQEASGDSRDFVSFSDSGTINQSAIDEFTRLFDNQANKIKAADEFGNDPLSPDNLGLFIDQADSPE